MKVNWSENMLQTICIWDIAMYLCDNRTHHGVKYIEIDVKGVKG